ncbi:expressed unknown protein [Seminavis robusta]|uniref:Uncharacterized protein n=1 Tax=Seminavis robusta TaxID=568900 RepID=A0A9N8EZF5_9STRA|nr:expressed unknown protein [Seminavis robusta]|eukprot:Sro2414_g326820.1 n/a (444) ;mRNA; f:10517-11848
MQGLSYCDINHRLQIRLCSAIPGCTLSDAKRCLLWKDGFASAQTVKLSISHDYFALGRLADELESFVSAMANAMPKLSEIHVQLLQHGFSFAAGHHAHKAVVPVELLEFLLQKFPRLERIKFCDLHIMTVGPGREQQQQQQQQRDSLQKLAIALECQSLLEHLELRHCSFFPVSSSRVDPLLTSLSIGVPTLEKLILQFPFQNGVSVSTTAVNALTEGCTRLRELHFKGLHTIPTCSKATPPSMLWNGCASLERLALHLPPLTSPAMSEAMGTELASLVHKAPKLVALTVNLHLLQAQGQQSTKCHSLQSFQSALASALRPTKLQELYILCHDEIAITRGGQSQQLPTLPVFCRVLQDTPTLTRLCLPHCGELDECVAFWLAVNQSGIRQFFLPLDDNDGNSQNRNSVARLGELGEFVSSKDDRTQLSMIYYVLREGCPLFLA